MNSYDLKDEKQAKEYLDKIGIEYRFQCYHQNLPDGCHRLASFLDTILRDFEKSRKVFEFNCSQNDYGLSCFKLGLCQMTGKGGEKNIQKAFDSFQKGCENKDGASCHNLALMFQDGKSPDGKKDFKKVEEFLIKGCEYKDFQSCYRLSGLYIKGKEGVPKNMQQAFKYSMMCCERDNPYACGNISIMYRMGEGVEKDGKKADQYKNIMLNLQESAKERTILSGGE